MFSARFPIYLEVEKKAGEFFGTEAAIYLPSGYLINLAGFQSLAQLGQIPGNVRGRGRSLEHY